jgi:N-acetylglucosaminyl-diphospho-decaprenol L-rhamnosyltransferase
MNRIDVSVIIVSYNTSDILQECLQRLYRESEGVSMEVIMVDNDSKDDSVEMVLSSFPEVKVIANDDNVGFAAANNQGIEIARGKYVLLLNSDAYVMHNTLQSSINFMESNPRCGIMGARLMCEDKTEQVSARTLPGPWHKLLVTTGLTAHFPNSILLGKPDYHSEGVHGTRMVGWVPGAYFMIRRELIDEIGMLDAGYFMYYEEVDFCLRASRNGWTVIYNSNVPVIHLGGASSARTLKPMSATGRQLLNYRIESEIRYYRKNYGRRYALMASLVDIAWRAIVFVKNTVLHNSTSAIKIQEARETIRLTFLAWRRQGLRGRFQN